MGASHVFTATGDAAPGGFVRAILERVRFFRRLSAVERRVEGAENAVTGMLLVLVSCVDCGVVLRDDRATPVIALGNGQQKRQFLCRTCADRGAPLRSANTGTLEDAQTVLHELDPGAHRVEVGHTVRRSGQASDRESRLGRPMSLNELARGDWR